jgi:diaminopimelate epimerase
VDVHVELLHGAENAFALLDDRATAVRPDGDYMDIARAISDTDGLLVLLPSARYDLRMRMFNPNGGEAEMCGNGVRCVARYLSERGEGEGFAVDTLAGRIGARVVSRAPFAVETQMGIPQIGAERKLLAAGARWRYVPVSTGNPHAVIFTDDVSRIDLGGVGPAIETHRDFPGGTNVHFAQILDRSHMRVAHWERGAGATQACGTGIVASAAAAIHSGKVDSPVTVTVPGGTLSLAWDGRGEALLTGPAEHTGARDLVLT